MTNNVYTVVDIERLDEFNYEAEVAIADAMFEQKEFEAMQRFWSQVDEELDNDDDYQQWCKEQDESLFRAIASGEFDYIEPDVNDIPLSELPY